MDVRLPLTLALGVFSGAARADKYGVDEAMAESGGGSWVAIFLVVVLLLYLHFKGK